MLEVPFVVTTKDYEVKEQRQVISLVKGVNVVTPPTPVVNRRKGKKRSRDSHSQVIAEVPFSLPAAGVSGGNPFLPAGASTTLPPTFAQPEFLSPRIQYDLQREDVLFPNAFNPQLNDFNDPFHQQAKPVPNSLVDFNSRPEFGSGNSQEISWSAPQTAASYNPFLQPIAFANPFLNSGSASPSRASPNNPFLVPKSAPAVGSDAACVSLHHFSSCHLSPI